MKHKALVLAPHHDDECIGCGGLILKLAQAHWAVSIAVIFTPLEGTESAEGQQRLVEAENAAAILGASRIGDLEIPSRSGMSEEDILWKMVWLIRSAQPDLLLMPHSQERDPEHAKTFRAAREALWLSESSHRPDLGGPVSPISWALGFEVWSPMVAPTLTIDISAQIDQKLAALACYTSQLNLIDYVSAAEGLAKYRGNMYGGCRYSESYSVERVHEQALAFLAV